MHIRLERLKARMLLGAVLMLGLLFLNLGCSDEDCHTARKRQNQARSRAGLSRPRSPRSPGAS